MLDEHQNWLHCSLPISPRWFCVLTPLEHVKESSSLDGGDDDDDNASGSETDEEMTTS